MSDDTPPRDDGGHDDDVSLHATPAEAAGAQPAAAPPLVLISAQVREAMWRHADNDTSHEIGGVLVGRVSEGDPTVVQVEAALPALETDASAVHITFTHDSWEQWHDLLDKDYVGRVIVGWYHSHPGLGVFLSGHDMFIQTNFFNQPWQVAVVLDPVRGEVGCFGWKAGEVLRLPPESVSPAMERAAPAPRGPADVPTTAGAPERSPEPGPPLSRMALFGWGVAIAMFVIVVIQTMSLAWVSRPLRGGEWYHWSTGDTFDKVATRTYGRAELGEALRLINAPSPPRAGWPARGDRVWLPSQAALLPPQATPREGGPQASGTAPGP